MTESDELLEWVPVVGFEGFYEINRLAQVRRVKSVKGARVGLILKAKSNGTYLFLDLCKEGNKRSRLLHRLVVETFLGEVPPHMEVCHNDGNPLNCRLSNLRVDTPKSNSEDRIRHGRGGPLWRKPDVLDAIRHLLSLGFGNTQIGMAIGVRTDVVKGIKYGKSYQEITQ